ncbi:hypothetical protein D3C85_1059110 [compost metagenome]
MVWFTTQSLSVHMGPSTLIRSRTSNLPESASSADSRSVRTFSAQVFSFQPFVGLLGTWSRAARANATAVESAPPSMSFW